MKKIITSFTLSILALFSWSQCVNYTVQVYSYTPLGGPTSITWTVENLENGNDIATGTAMFNSFTYQATATVCLEPGCYNLHLVGNEPIQQTNSGGAILLNGDIILPTNVLEYGTQILNYNFCTGAQEPSCTACFTTSVTEGLLTISNCSSPLDGPNTSYAWDFGDNTSGDAINPTHQYTANGTYQVCVVMVVTDGEGLVTCISDLCHEVVVEGLTVNDCPGEIWSGPGDGCGVMHFEIGSYVDGESVIWYPGDGTGPINGGHFLSHTYTNSGEYTVCAYYTSPQCPDGVELCTNIVVQACEPPCNDVTIYVMSYVVNEGPASGVISIFDQSTNDQVLFEQLEWSENIQTQQITTCLPDGCYEIVVDGACCINFGGNYNISTYSAGATVTTGAFVPNDNISGTMLLSVNADCGIEGGCATSIAPQNIDCDSFLFSVVGGGPGDVVWTFGDGSGETSGNQADHTYAQDGVYEIHATFSNSNCEGVVLVTTVEVNCNGDCPNHFGVHYHCDQGTVSFNVDGWPEGSPMTWYFNNEQYTTENNWFTIEINEGWINLCAWSDGLSEQGCPEVCDEIYIQGCGGGNDCPEAIWSGAGNDCGVMYFEIGSYVEGESVTWYPGDESGAVVSGHFWTHTYENPGTYQVCAWYTSPACPNGVELCTEIVVYECGGDNCPYNIVAQQIDCNSFLFSVDGVETGQVQWNFGDGTGELSNTPSADHSYEQAGIYVVTAYYASDACAGTYLIYTVVVDCENFNECPDAIWSNAGDDCGVMHFEIGSYVQGENVTWYPGDETGAVEGGHYWTHVYAEPGIYTVCAFYTSPLCPDGVELCTQIVVESCGGGDCPESISHSAGDCGSFNFEIGSFSEGESVDWYVGEYLAQENGGHFWQTTFESEGWITVCAHYTSNACPDGVWLCTEVYSHLCGGECTEVGFGLDSFVADGGPSWLSWHLFNGDGLFIADGIAQYSENDPWYDWSDCLPNGCYSLYICAPDEFNGAALDLPFSGGWEVVEINPVVAEDCFGYQVLLSLNSECGNGSDDCQAGFEVVYTETPGHVEFENTSTFQGDANYYWNYGNGTGSDGMGGNAWYTENGEYQVCLTITTSEGCTDTYCQTIVIDGFETECQGTQVVLQITTNYPEPGDDSWSITVSWNGETLGTFPFVSCFECPEVITSPALCLEDGCYTVAFNSDLGINASEILVAAYLLGEELPLGDISIGYDQEAGEFQVGINDDCGDHVAEAGAVGSFTVYPNPASDQVSVMVSQEGDYRIEAMDATGRVVAMDRFSGERYSLSATSWATGIYTLRLTGDAGVYTRKVQVMH